MAAQRVFLIRAQDKKQDTVIWMCCGECHEQIYLSVMTALRAHQVARWMSFQEPTPERQYTVLGSPAVSLSPSMTPAGMGPMGLE